MPSLSNYTGGDARAGVVKRMVPGTSLNKVLGAWIPMECSYRISTNCHDYICEYDYVDYEARAQQTYM